MLFVDFNQFGNEATRELIHVRKVPAVVYSSMVFPEKYEVRNAAHVIENGADDYLSSYFTQEQIARRGRQILLKRAEINPFQGKVVLGDQIIDIEKRNAISSDSTVSRFFPTEWKVLALLLSNSGRVIGNEELIAKVFGARAVEEEIDSFERETVVVLSRLRKKLKNPELVQTFHDMGHVIM